MYRFGFRRMKGSCMMHIIRDFCNTEHSSIVDLVFSEREVVKYSRSCSLYVVARPSLCLSVTFVRPSQAIEIFRNVSTPFLHCPSIDNLTSTKNFSKIVPGNPRWGRGLNARGEPNIAIFDISKAISRKRCNEVG